MATCKVCGSPHKACGPSTASLIADPIYRKPEEATMGLHEYNVTEKGIPTTMLLSDEDAARAGLTKKDRATAAPSAPVEAPSAEPVVLTSADGETVEPLTADEVTALRELLTRVAEADAEDDDEPEEDVNDDETPEEEQVPAEKAAPAPRNKQAPRATNKAATPEAEK